MKRMLHDKHNRSGFTIVELLIVIVVIAILAVISIVAYNGIQQRARSVAVKSALSQASKKVLLYYADNSSTYPSTLTAAGVSNDGAISYNYSSDTNGYCITALYNLKTPTNIRSDGTISDGPCDGQSGGSDYCPTNSFVPTNGYFCDGTEGSIAALNSSAIKLSAATAGVPAGAPGAYVGRQASRDNYYTTSFSVTPGEVYCVEGWVATTDAIIGHAIGLQFTNSSGVNSWHNGTSYTTPTPSWKKISACLTVPAGIVSARGWSQNNGNNPEAQAYWYQTAIRLWKQ